VVMVPPRCPRGWGRQGFGTRRSGRGAGRTGRQSMSWYRKEWQQRQDHPPCQEGGEGSSRGGEASLNVNRQV
jgi:hypothetical protein